MWFNRLVRWMHRVRLYPTPGQVDRLHFALRVTRALYAFMRRIEQQYCQLENVAYSLPEMLREAETVKMQAERRLRDASARVGLTFEHQRDLDAEGRFKFRERNGLISRERSHFSVESATARI
jgi:hypothetical protein